MASEKQAGPTSVATDEHTIVPRLAPVAAVTVGVGLLVLVGADGSPLWRVVRVVVVAGATALAWRVLRGGDAAASAVAFAVGVVAFPVGVAIAGPHLAKAGAHPRSVAGLLVLGGGLVLLVVGAVGLVRRARSWWRIPVAVGLVVTTLLGLWTLGQAVAATNVPPTEVGATTPAARGLAYEDVTFDTPDGVTLAGWWIPSGNGAAVVLAHGAGSTRASVLDQATVLARNGYGVLAFDARGHGDSDGRAMDFGWWGNEDVAGAVSFVAAQPGVHGARIAAVGLSMGGEEVLGATASDPRIAAVVAEGATNRVPDDKDWLSERYGWRGAVQERIEWVVYAVADVLTSADQPMGLRDAVVATAPRPVLLVAAGDVPTEGEVADRLQAGSPGNVEVWVVAGADHTGGLETAPEEWEARVVGFLDEALDVRDGGG
ncbi:MAG: alpha/beta fold hydrolase [Acidimicrobiales bacterium]|jgi:pimeloyl-ACP methyl ester carboxylesterase|nr:alpha/beta fold hydrolase [Acidimicrobiales bacterium]